MSRSRLHSTEWNASPGPLTLEIKAVRIFVMHPLVSLDSVPGMVPIVADPLTADEVWRFRLSAAQVANLRSQPTQDDPPYLKVTVGAYPLKGAPDRQWGWAFRLLQENLPLVCQRDHGTAVKQDSLGFLRRDPRSFPENLPMDGEFDYVTLR